MNTTKTLSILISLSLSTIILFTTPISTTASHPTDPTYVESSQGLPTVGQWPFNTAVGDVNHDGYLDLIRLRGHDDFNPEDEGFQIWLGDGQGAWTKTAIPNGNFGYGGTALGDFNNDGYLDAAYGCHHYNSHPMIGAWTGDGGTSFTEHSDGLATDGESFGMAECTLADFTNDGYLDLIVGAFSGTSGIRAYINHNGGENWSSASTGLPHNDVSPMVNHWILAPDINRDGNLDIVIQERDIDGTTHFIWTGDGTGNWTANDYGLPVEWFHGTDGLDVGDINNDGWPDITFIHHTSFAVPVVYTFDGTSWTPASDGLPTTQNYGPLAFGDLNNDGYLDLVGLEDLGNYHTAVHAWLGDGTGHWTELPLIATGIVGGPESVTLADIDHNGHLDIILSAQSDGDYTPGGIHVFKETSPASGVAIHLQQPTGGEVYPAGSVRTITWTSSIPYGTPVSIDLEYSYTGQQGPWYPIATDILDTNSYQWHIPNVNTHQGYLRATITSDQEQMTVYMQRPFSIIGAQGSPPSPPSITGPTTGLIGQTLQYNFTSLDQEGNPCQMFVKWGDDTDGEWLTPTPTGTSTANHTWTFPRHYPITAFAIDTTGQQSAWSDPYFVTIGPNITIGPADKHYTVIINNSGTTDCTNLTTIIDHTGFILCRHHKTHSTPMLHPGENQTTSIFFLGWGPVTITVTIKASEFPEMTWTTRGILLKYLFIPL